MNIPCIKMDGKQVLPDFTEKPVRKALADEFVTALAARPDDFGYMINSSSGGKSKHVLVDRITNLHWWISGYYGLWHSDRASESSIQPMGSGFWDRCRIAQALRRWKQSREEVVKDHDLNRLLRELMLTANATKAHREKHDV